jgi:hypothetical protein
VQQQQQRSEAEDQLKAGVFLLRSVNVKQIKASEAANSKRGQYCSRTPAEANTHAHACLPQLYHGCIWTARCKWQPKKTAGNDAKQLPGM